MKVKTSREGELSSPPFCRGRGPTIGTVSTLPRKLRRFGGVLQGNAIEERDPCVIATAYTIETIIEDPLLPILKEDSNITKPAGQIRRPGLDHNPTSPRFKLFMIDLIPHPKISVFFNV